MRPPSGARPYSLRLAGCSDGRVPTMGIALKKPLQSSLSPEFAFRLKIAMFRLVEGHSTARDECGIDKGRGKRLFCTSMPNSYRKESQTERAVYLAIGPQKA